jgi:hypothetical protein
MRARTRGCLTAVLAITVSATALGQDSTSSALAKQLAAALAAAKLDSIAAKDPAAPDVYIGALYFPGVQLLVVSAKYTVPALLNDKLAKKEYRDVYIDLNSASVPESKIFVEDLGAEGLKAERNENQPYDSYEAGGKRIVFDGDWKKQKMTKDEYMKAFAAADERYSKMLEALLNALKRAS